MCVYNICLFEFEARNFHNIAPSLLVKESSNFEELRGGENSLLRRHRFRCSEFQSITELSNKDGRNRMFTSLQHYADIVYFRMNEEISKHKRLKKHFG
jgi:hypothetical protein